MMRVESSVCVNFEMEGGSELALYNTFFLFKQAGNSANIPSERELN